MDNNQLEVLEKLLNRFRREYNLDSMTEFVYIPSILKQIKELK